jgi:predicted transposase YdaD
MIDHDRLFKELLSTFFVEFIELFMPDVMAYLEPDSMTFLDKEVFTDVTAGERYEADLLVQAQFRGELSCFLIHVENQAKAQANFGKRMFRYFARLSEKYDLPIYPVVVFSYDQPKVAAASQFLVEFPEFRVLEFNYRVIQLNRLNWRDYLGQANPVASALMAKMQIAPEDRPRVKAECLRLLVTLRLDSARMQLISGFVDTYLTLTESEEQAFQEELGRIEPEAEERVMQIVTSWMQTGIEQGRREGIQEGIRLGKVSLVMRLLHRCLGELDAELEARIRNLLASQLDVLSEALLDFASVEDLIHWLDSQEKRGLISIILRQLHRKVGELEEEVKAQVRELEVAQLEELSEALLDFEHMGDLTDWLRNLEGGEQG